MLPLKFIYIYIYFFFFYRQNHLTQSFNDSSTCYQSSTEEIVFLFFILFDVGVALVPRPLFKSSSILCQETLWQKGTGTNNSAREEHTSQTQSGNNLLPLAQFTRAY